MKKEVIKETISIKDAKSIAEIPKPELRKEAVKVIQRQDETKDYVIKTGVDIATGKKKPDVKIINLNERAINQFIQIYKQVIMKMTTRLADSYDEQTKIRMKKIMMKTLIHLQKELKITGDIIDMKELVLKEGN